HRQAEGFAEADADGRGSLDDDRLFGVGKGRPDGVGRILFLKGAGRAGGDALAAGDAGDVGEVLVKGGADVGREAALVRADDAAVLVLPADGDAAPAEDALGVVADDMDGGIVDLILVFRAVVVVLI